MFLYISFLLSLHYRFTNDFVSCLFLIIALSYYSIYKNVTLKKAFPEHNSCANWGCGWFQDWSRDEGTKGCLCHAEWTQEGWQAVRRGTVRVGRELYHKATAQLQREQDWRRGRCEWGLLQKEKTSFSGKENELSSCILASLCHNAS